MKYGICLSLYLVFGMISFAFELGGTNPGGGPASFFQLVSTNLNPETFQVTLGVNVPDRIFNIEVYEGANPSSNATWTTMITMAPSEGVTYVTDIVGPLTTNGRTYRAVIPGPNPVYSVNEIFVAYPYLENPSVRVDSGSVSNSQVSVQYGEGIYSNSVVFTIPSNSPAGFFRVYSPDKYPTNAVVQFRTNLNANVWCDISSDE